MRTHLERLRFSILWGLALGLIVWWGSGKLWVALAVGSIDAGLCWLYLFINRNQP